MTDDELKRELLGEIRIRKDQNFSPDLKAFFQPFESAEGVMYAFCTSCGLLYELKIDEVTPLFALTGEQYRVEPGLYFELHACGMCHGSDASVYLKKVPRPLT